MCQFYHAGDCHYRPEGGGGGHPLPACKAPCPWVDGFLIRRASEYGGCGYRGPDDRPPRVVSSGVDGYAYGPYPQGGGGGGLRIIHHPNGGYIDAGTCKGLPYYED